MMLRTLAILSTLLLLGACAHHRDVRPGAEGINRVVIKSDDQDDATRDAISQANHYCKEKKNNTSAAFIDESKKYTGDMDEKTYKNAKRATTVAKTVGGTVWAMGAKKESNIGGIAGIGGAAADEAFGKAYTVEMKFKCQ